jgi:microcystin-dependent protein
MTTNYPGALDTTTQLKNDLIDATVTSGLHAVQSNNAADAILAIETELGVNPSGSGYATVVARLDDAAIKSPTASQIFQGVNDVVPLISRLKAGGVANLYEAQNSAGSVLAYITRLGELSAQGLSIAGTPLASTHLSDTAALARLASPAFTGTPTAPTPSNGDSSTKLATTAFVAANGVPAGAITAFGGASAPTGWLLCDGSAVNRTTYATLFALFSTTYGVGDGSTTFNLPDLRGRTIVGKGTNLDTLGESDGLGVGSRTPKHNHGVGTLAVATAGGHGHAHTLAIGASGSHSHGTDSQGSHSHGGNTSAGGASGANTSGAIGTTNVQGPGAYGVGVNSHYHDVGFFGSHTHSIATDTAGGHGHNITAATHTHATGDFTGSIGGADGTHTHGVSGTIGTTAGVAETPAFFVLNYIVKT